LGWLERKNAAFKEKENIELGKLREEILDAVREVGKEEGYDFIFDRSGASGANVLILAYAKDATDLTALVLERINRDAPKKDKDQEDPKEGE
jgi:Skp family chaperone for outer membrane proteins